MKPIKKNRVPPTRPNPPFAPVEFWETKDFVPVVSPQHLDGDDTPMGKIAAILEGWREDAPAGSSLVLKMGDSYDGPIFEGIGYYVTNQVPVAGYKEQLKRYERDLKAYELNMQQYEKELKEYEEWKAGEEKKDLDRRLREARKLLKEHGEL